ncbi:sugar ABC transporter ATP-binding protein [Ornithinimicrobium cavernae]|uniref:sugar ABC transporter ATP-binding protein n=1 Tax=Ornithinimicrobium cavernae TaxID=2666047 RepID=UPI001F2F4FB5|nr:sugar ABC transporter ATP-binding protein [Ornithinimicrobium cavernae]
MTAVTSTGHAPVLAMTGIVKHFGGVQALRGANLTVRAGEVLALMGENGAGKSTMMNILAGVIQADGGALTVDGQPHRFSSPAAAQAAGVAMIPQELDLVPQASVADNIFLGDELRTRWRTVDRRAMRRKAKDLLDDLEIPISPERAVGSLRVGEQQMVAITKALRLNARIVVMDEPTSALSDSEVRRLFDLIPGLRRRGVATIYISHRMDEIFEIADRGTVMRDGLNAGEFEPGTTAVGEVIRMMTGRPIDQVYPDREPPAEDVRLRVRDLRVAAGLGQSGRREPAGVDLEVRRGEILGLAGLLGAGRTELLEAIFGTSGHALSGSVEVDGEPVTIRSPRDASELGIGLVPEDRRHAGLIMPASVADNIVLLSLRRIARKGLRRVGAERAAVAGAITDLNIKTHRQETIVGTLSGGNQQKVVFAKNLLTQPRVLLLDEPTRGVDVGAKSEIYRLLARLAADGMSVIVASSEVPELVGICDRIAVLRDGRVVTVLDRADATQEAILSAASLKTSAVGPADGDRPDDSPADDSNPDDPDTEES